MLHFLDGFFVFFLAQAVEAPVTVHAGMEKILVDGRQLMLQLAIQPLDNVCVAFHVFASSGGFSN
jgi:hypothetical protein